MITLSRMCIHNKDVIRTITGELLKHPDIISVYLFGSFASGKITSESDVDLGVLFRENIDINASRIIDLNELLSERAGVSIDIVVLNSAPPRISMQILRNGKIIVNRDVLSTARWISGTIMRYDDYKYSISSIERAILKGKVYD